VVLLVAPVVVEFPDEAGDSPSCGVLGFAGAAVVDVVEVEGWVWAFANATKPNTKIGTMRTFFIDIKIIS
jgi:hypothetical protein